MITTVVPPAEQAVRPASAAGEPGRFGRPVPRMLRVAAPAHPSAVRAERVAALRDAVRSGAYVVDCDAVAAALADRLRAARRG